MAEVVVLPWAPATQIERRAATISASNAARGTILSFIARAADTLVVRVGTLAAIQSVAAEIAVASADRVTDDLDLPRTAERRLDELARAEVELDEPRDAVLRFAALVELDFVRTGREAGGHPGGNPDSTP